MPRTALCLSAAALFLVAGSSRADKFSDLLRSLPGTVNAVVVCDVESVYGSPLAVKNKWAATSAIGFPAGIQQIVQGTTLDPDTLRPTGFEFGVAYLKVRLTMDELAVREMGSRDSLPFAEAVLSPRNAYFLELRAWTIGMVAPANRQEAARWVRYTRDSPRVNLSPFLTSAVVNTDRSTQYVLALDLVDALHQPQVKAKLAASPAVAGKGVDLDALTKVITGMQGLRLEVRVGNDIKAELRAEFNQDVGPFAALAVPLFQDVLAHRGATVEEIADWKAEATGKTLVFRGPLSEKSFRRVAHILQGPSPNVGTGEEAAQLAAELKRLASQHYFATVNTFLQDVQRPDRQARKSFENTAHWYDTFAQRIGQLPMYNVDEDLLKYGYTVAERLHATAESLRGVVVDVTALEKKISYSVSIGAQPTWGWRSAPSVWIDTNQAQIQAAQREAIAQGEQIRDQIWKSIEADTAAVRARMAQKFGTGF